MKKDPGYYRYAKGSGFIYKNERSKIIVSKSIKSWITSLAIPPAWKDVWISKDRDAYMLVTGYDDKNRKQYVYHPNAEVIREEKKLSRLLQLGRVLPKIRRRVSRDLNQSGLTKDRVLAAVVQIILDSGMRVGNNHYTQANGTYGATTLRKKHVNGKKEKTFNYIGKSGVDRTIELSDPKTIQVITECEDTAGLQLFKYFDEAGARHNVSSDEVNEYIKRIAKTSLTAKDFRTWYGSVAALEKCVELGKCQDACEKIHMKTIFKHAANLLGNTPKIAADSYVHESVLIAHKAKHLQPHSTSSKVSLDPIENLLLSLLQDHAKTV